MLLCLRVRDVEVMLRKMCAVGETRYESHVREITRSSHKSFTLAQLVETYIGKSQLRN